MQPGALTGTKGEKSRRELMEIAIDCFARFGFQGSSVDRIARMAGVTKGAIYYHFRDKEDLLAAAVADRIAAFEARVQRACDGVTADQALRRIAEVCAEHAESNDHPRFIITLMVEAIETNETISTQLRDMMRRFRGFLRNLIKDAQERGVFRADREARAVAAGYVSWILGAEVQFYQDPQHFDFRAAMEIFLEQLISDLRPRTPAADTVAHATKASSR
jgi:TetR/AcrR family acrAB operon transcriptional repressor